MKFVALLLVLVFVGGQGAWASESNAGEIGRSVQKSLVSIRVFRDEVPVASGSGFSIAADGTLITNYHVIEGGDAIEVRFHDGEIFSRALVIDVDEKHDLAFFEFRLPVSLSSIWRQPEAPRSATRFGPSAIPAARRPSNVLELSMRSAWSTGSS